MVDVTEPSPGVFRVHYQTGDDLSPELQGPVIKSLEAASLRGATALLFVLEPAIRLVEMSVPTFWLGVTARTELRLGAMAIVTRSIAVRTAARGFGIANTVRHVPIEVATFGTEAEAIAWIRATLAKPG